LIFFEIYLLFLLEMVLIRDWKWFDLLIILVYLILSRLLNWLWDNKSIKLLFLDIIFYLNLNNGLILIFYKYNWSFFEWIYFFYCFIFYPIYDVINILSFPFKL
jgi:hypothetical protein